MEIKCKDSGTRYEWVGDSLKTFKLSHQPIKVTALSTANKIDCNNTVQVNERTNKKTWFNSIAAAYGRADSTATYGNGDEIDKSDFESMVSILNVFRMTHRVQFDCLVYIMKDLCVAFKWQQGDVLLLDNT